MRSLVSAVRPSYRIQRVLAKGSLRRSSFFDVKRLENTKATRDRFSIVVSKKVGKTAVLRNRIKRRLKEGLRLALKEREEREEQEKKLEGLEGTDKKTFDYVVIGKKTAEIADFEDIKDEMTKMIS